MLQRNNLQRHGKCQFCALGDGAKCPDEAKYKMAPNSTRKSFPIKTNLFLF